jgi:hypothetical protein
LIDAVEDDSRGNGKVVERAERCGLEVDLRWRAEGGGGGGEIRGGGVRVGTGTGPTGTVVSAAKDDDRATGDRGGQRE